MKINLEVLFTILDQIAIRSDIMLSLYKTEYSKTRYVRQMSNFTASVTLGEAPRHHIFLYTRPTSI